jgi:hypothetical protein
MRQFRTPGLICLALLAGCADNSVPPHNSVPPQQTATVVTSEESKVQQLEPEPAETAQLVSGLPSHWITAPDADAPVTKLTAAEFGTELKSDPSETLQRYSGKWLEITGFVDSISNLNGEGESQLTIPGQDDLPVGYKNFHLDLKRLLVFNMAEPALWKITSPGSKVTIRGVLARVPAGAGFDHSTIVSADGPPVKEIQASDLAKAFEDDPMACKASFNGKAFVVSGDFQAYDENDSDRPLLNGSEKVAVALDFRGRVPEFENLSAGEPVVVYGICEVDTSEIALQKIKLTSVFRIQSPAK